MAQISNENFVMSKICYFIMYNRRLFKSSKYKDIFTISINIQVIPHTIGDSTQ